MPGLFAGRKVLITGASRGIGAATARCFASEQAELFIHGRDQIALETLAETLHRDYTATCHILNFDISDSQAVARGFRELFSVTKTLDVLINNAGMRSDALLAMVTPQSLEQSFATNSFGAFYCCQYAARMMRRAGGGAIVNIASVMALGGFPGQSVYAASKAAMLGMTRALAKELAPDQIRVNAIAPGFIETDLVADLSAEQRQKHLAHIALGHPGASEDVARSALFLSSSWANYITGECLRVDGGMSL
ncbi:SDR family NAD(P)-dependent oxidoreductase [Celerinatantimonas sp. YJH-8]|uniref:SDR family NAD(P)-dependent oxidoreductase n=1 Tax=Celerinatantimonas sp. YJH-8 TaxID=3228714 RepID=UPI0038C25798